MSFLKTLLIWKKGTFCPTQNSETWNKHLPIFYCNLPSISPPTYNTAGTAMTTSTSSPCHREAAHRARWGEGLWVCCCQSQKPGKCEENAEAKMADVCCDRWVWVGPGGGPEGFRGPPEITLLHGKINRFCPW